MSKFKDLVFGIDFDGTCVLHEFPKMGKDVPGAVETLKWIIENGGKLVLNTMRSNTKDKDYLTEAVNWFDKHGIELYGVNKNPDQTSWTSSPKVYANIYIDDAALGTRLVHSCTNEHRPHVCWGTIRDLLTYHRQPIVKIHGKETVTE